MGVVWLASYPKSGNTWVRFLLSSYVFGPAETWVAGANGVVLELEARLRKAREEGISEEETLRQAEAELSWSQLTDFRPKQLMFKTHYLWNADHPLPSLRDRTRGFIYLIRHPKDVLLSSLNYARLRMRCPGTDEDYAREFIRAGGDQVWIRQGYGSWAEHVESWVGTRGFPHIVIRYEDLRAEPQDQFRRILDFLGLPVSETRVAVAVGQCSLEELRRLEIEAHNRDPSSQRPDGYFFHNKGLCAQRLEHIAGELDQMFDDHFGQALAKHGYVSPRSATTQIDQDRRPDSSCIGMSCQEA